MRLIRWMALIHILVKDLQKEGNLSNIMNCTVVVYTCTSQKKTIVCGTDTLRERERENENKRESKLLILHTNLQKHSLHF